MSRTIKRSAAFAAASLAAISLSVAGAGTAGAATCNTNEYFTAGIVHAAEAHGQCGWLTPGNGVKGINGTPNRVVLANLVLPNGSHTIAWVDDITGLYPTHK